MRQPTLVELIRAQAYAQQHGNLARVRKLAKIIEKVQKELRSS
jgi:hypothetical protein